MKAGTANTDVTWQDAIAGKPAPTGNWLCPGFPVQPVPPVGASLLAMKAGTANTDVTWQDAIAGKPAATRTVLF